MPKPLGKDELGDGGTTAGPSGRLYSYDELAQATQGFSIARKLGAGGYGPVFRGMLDGVPVAVKLLDTSGISTQGQREFQAEIAILSRLHHPHIVLLMGSCPERCALVYELLDNGNLEHHLFSPALPDLQWQDRIRIACEVISALVFLHSAPEPIVHMDLKPANILLNKSLVSKVADVGLSRLMPAATPAAALRQLAGGSAGPLSPPTSTVLDSRLVGTPSYVDPEYIQTGRFGPKSDTYSLGVILLQMLTGREASLVVPLVESALSRSQTDAASFATIVDKRSGSWPVTEAASFAHLAVRCVAKQRSQRPDLRSEVLPALLQLAERARLYDSSRDMKRSTSIGRSNQPPSMFICPITQDVMDDPVFAADGYTYERVAIAGWIEHHDTSPMTNLPLAHTGLTPNLALRSAIKEWQDKQSK
eukprot:GHRR01019435.1.p1 GENE.GHRR01019435.1~~GHRR01019435.1.p1  ORF type:complete len:420 (+),score=137.92 GHRR01019435.1:571-1830(+)